MTQLFLTVQPIHFNFITIVHICWYLLVNYSSKDKQFSLLLSPVFNPDLRNWPIRKLRQLVRKSTCYFVPPQWKRLICATHVSMLSYPNRHNSLKCRTTQRNRLRVRKCLDHCNCGGGHYVFMLLAFGLTKVFFCSFGFFWTFDSSKKGREQEWVIRVKHSSNSV